MNVAIGLWLIALGISIMIVSLESCFDIKEKIMFVFGVMAVLTLFFIGAYFITGGV